MGQDRKKDENKEEGNFRMTSSVWMVEKTRLRE